MEVTAKNNKDNIGYIEGVLTKWEEAGAKAINQAREFESQFKERMKKNNIKGVGVRAINQPVVSGIGGNTSNTRAEAQRLEELAREKGLIEGTLQDPEFEF